MEILTPKLRWARNIYFFIFSKTQLNSAPIPHPSGLEGNSISILTGGYSLSGDKNRSQGLSLDHGKPLTTLPKPSTATEVQKPLLPSQMRSLEFCWRLESSPESLATSGGIAKKWAGGSLILGSTNLPSLYSLQDLLSLRALSFTQK